MKQLWRYGTAAMVVAISLLADGVVARGQEHLFISPGIKLGYTFGSEGGFTFGAEVSVTSFNEDNGDFVGGVIDWDIVTSTGRQKLHIGAEGGWAFFGIDIGPTLVIEPSGEKLFGFTITPYAGALGYLYYSTTIVSGRSDAQELGLYLKAPIHADSKGLTWFH